MLNKIIILFLITNGIVYSQTIESINGFFQDINPNSNIIFYNNKIKYTKFGNPPETEIISFKEYKVKNNHYIEFDYPGNWFNPDIPRGNTKFLVLFKDGILFLYIDDNLEPVNNGILGRNIYSIFLNTPNYLVSSYLSENTENGFKEYKAQNLKDIKLCNPWVEGSIDYGIGDFIEITQEESTLKGFIISNGYISYKRPELYEWNSRLKKIKITEKNGKFNFIADIEDQQNLQYIQLPEPANEIRLEIIDVYEGTKFKDTSVNFILPVYY